jgi:hypothetical protein
VIGLAKAPGLPIIEVHPADLLLYFDPSSSKPVDDGVNQVAIIIDERHALLVEPGRAQELPLSNLGTLQNAHFRHVIEDPNTADSVVDYFTRHRKNPAYLEAGFRAYQQQNFRFFADGPFPERPHYVDQASYDAAWKTFEASLRPHDCIFTTCRTSITSRLIAWATDGPWSHCATYLGEGEIWESVTSGIRYERLDVYRGRKFWIAAYRHVRFCENPPSMEQARNSVIEASAQYKQGYNYGMALWNGLRAFVGRHAEARGVPNSIILQGSYALVAHV